MRGWLPVLLVAISPILDVAALASASYQQDGGPDGLVWIAAADQSSSQPGSDLAWQVAAKASDETSVVLVRRDASGAGGAPSLPLSSYRIVFTKSGAHYLWARGHGPTGGATLTAGLRGQGLVGIRLPAGSPSWANRPLEGPPASFTVPNPGEYTLEVGGRDAGLSLDRILITSNPDLHPSALEAAAPPRLLAYYSRLRSSEDWEALERVGPHADVVVRLPEASGSLVFWRGSSYLPYWETENGRWFMDEVVPRSGDGDGLRSDRTNLYARADLIESTPSRAVVRWRYVRDFDNSGLDGWTEEYFAVSPDGLCVRSVRSGTPTLEEWHDPSRSQMHTLRLTPGGIVPTESGHGSPLELSLGKESEKAAGGPVADPYAYEIPVLPEGSPEPGPFGAHYVHLRYFEEWDEPWRVGPHADVVVQFDDHPHRLVFWRGADYVPHWANDLNHWYNNEFVERRASDAGLEGCCAEPMQDHEARYSSARIISNTDARAVVHWRYAPSDRNYDVAYVDETGWGDRVDEYYYVYPDAVAVRDVTLYTSEPYKFNEWHEAIPLVNPGKIPEDVLDMEAIALTDDQGNQRVYSWQDGFPKTLDDGRHIMLVGLRGSTRPFVVVESRGVWVDEISLPDESRFNHYDDWPGWPANMRGGSWERNPDTGYREFWKTLPSHSSLMHFLWDDYAQDLEGPVKWKRKIMLNGLTAETDANALIPLSRSWETPPLLRLRGSGYAGGGYDKAQRAYRIEKISRDRRSFEATLEASARSPLVNAALVIDNWPEAATARLTLDGQPVPAGAAFRQGIERTTDGGAALVVWIQRRSESPVTLAISPD